MNRTLLSLVALGVACNGSKDSGSGSLPAETGEAVSTYSRIVAASYEDSVVAAQELDIALEALVDGPSESTMASARTAWLASREPYLQTEVYRFYDGPIDNPEDGPEGLINAWPMDENAIDYVVGDDNTGIVNGSETIDAATLTDLNEAGGEKNITTGFHAIEFLLWGQDMSATGPGERPYTDYVTDGTGTAANQDRRGLYLTVAGDLLITHLESVHTQWESGAAYRTDFESDTERALERILTGMIVLSGFETGGERLQAALDSGDQEDEHSCFSDNTHRDMIQDVQGVQNVWLGRYVRTDGSVVEGTSLKSVVAARDTALADRLDAQIADSLSLANAMQVPFDQEIAPGSDGNARVLALVESLRAQEQVLFEVFDLFGLSVEIPE